jgi:hypothetical protein
MGIERLTQDILPYGETVLIGNSSKRPDTTNITDLVIDGPSLVYHVYNKLLLLRTFEAGVGAVQYPNYREITDGVLYLLSELESHGAKIQSIYFDGALLGKKIPTRFERLERAIEQLNDYRKLHNTAPPVPASPEEPSCINFGHALWLPVAVSARKKLLPPPPFMVPAVIQCLVESSDILKPPKYKDIVHVVPEEADLACARAVRNISAGILSNDSDMCVYDLGSSASLILLQSLEKRIAERGAAEPEVSTLSATQIRPADLIHRLHIPSVVALAFHRERDNRLGGKASTSVIAERARQPIAISSERSVYDSIAADYIVDDPSRKRSHVPPLNHLDPRVAELVVDYTLPPESRAVYVPSPSIWFAPLYEDPSRDAAWSYGAEIRQVAYSLFIGTLPKPLHFPQRPSHVTEFARRGRRPVGSPVKILSLDELQRAMWPIHRLASQIGRSTPSETTRGYIGSYWLNAVAHVAEQKAAQGRSLAYTEVTSLLSRSYSYSNAPSREPHTWPDVHLHACATAVLYSLRILAQLCRYITTNTPSSSLTQLTKTMQLNLIRLGYMFEDLPFATDLFLDINGVRACMSTHYFQGMIRDRFARITIMDETPGTQLQRKRAGNTTATPEVPAKRRNQFAALMPDSDADSEGDNDD